MKPTDDRAERELTTALRETLPAPPHDDVDYAALHRTVTTRAATLLAKRRFARPGVWQTLSGWATRAIPLTAAAAAALLIMVKTGPQRVPEPALAEPMLSAAEYAVAGELQPLLSASASDDEWLDALLLYGEGQQQ